MAIGAGIEEILGTGVSLTKTPFQGSGPLFDTLIAREQGLAVVRPGYGKIMIKMVIGQE